MLAQNKKALAVSRQVVDFSVQEERLSPGEVCKVAQLMWNSRLFWFERLYIARGALGAAFRVHNKTSKVRRFNDWMVLCGLFCNVSVFSKRQWRCLVTDVITSLSRTGGEAEGQKPSALDDLRGQTWSACIWFFQTASYFILFYSLRGGFCGFDLQVMKV